jgi:GNAT superfamily N-acetyltransferase
VSGAEGGPSFVALAIDPASGTLGGLVAGAPRDDIDDANWLSSMWVAPHARNGGLGRRLVRAVIAWSRSTDRPRLLLRVAESNAAAITLYEACGFVPTGQRVPLRPGSVIATVVMEHRP